MGKKKVLLSPSRKKYEPVICTFYRKSLKRVLATTLVMRQKNEKRELK